MIYTVYDIDNIPKGSYGVIGCPIEHSLSPIIHNTLSNSCGYFRILIKPDDLLVALPVLINRLKGFNVTIPHKVEIIKFLDEIDKTAEEYGAVNTVKCGDGIIKGYNTDGEGFRAALKYKNMSLRGKGVLLIGSGGVARVIAYEAVKEGSPLTILCRNLEKGEALKKRILSSYKDAEIRVLNSFDGGQYGLLVNATPLGMYPREDEMPIESKYLDNIESVFDTVYNPYDTKLIKEAEKRKIVSQNGLFMLTAQGVAARKIWTGEEFKEDKLINITELLKSELKEKRK